MPDYLDRRPNEYHEPIAARSSFIVVPEEQIEPHRGALAIFASVKRKGVWSLARRFRLAVVMAEAKLDLREVRIGPGVSMIELFALWASVEIVVPPGIRIDVHDSALMGDINWEASESEYVVANAPTVLVRGSVIMSSVNIKVRYLGETEREAKKRIKATRG